MKTVFSKNINRKIEVFMLCAAFYLALIFLSIFTPLGKLYVFEWTLRNMYCFNWLLAAVLILFNALPTACAVAAGNFAGVFIGQFLGGFMEDYAAKQITADMTKAEAAARLEVNYQWGLWALTCLCFAVVGIICNVIARVKRKPSEQSDNN